MLFILLNEGMEHQIRDGKDVIVAGDTVYPLQDAVKKACQHRKKKYEPSEVDGLTIYFAKKVPNIEATFLRYGPNCNGKNPSDSVSVVRGDPNRGIVTTGYGQFWFQGLGFSDERLAEIEAKRTEQRHNRRHDGDSPLPT